MRGQGISRVSPSMMLVRPIKSDASGLDRSKGKDRDHALDEPPSCGGAVRTQTETGNRNLAVSLLRCALNLEPELRHSELFLHRDQDRRIFTNYHCRPFESQRFPLIQQHLIHLAQWAYMFKRDVFFPVLVARRSNLLGCVTYAMVRLPVFPTETPAFKVKRDCPKHLVDGKARFDPRLGAID